MGAANSRSGSTRVSPVGIADSAERRCRAALRLPTRAGSIHIGARQARRLPYNGFDS
jgi:hypothetical protein